jgi:hypothetical protein
MSFLLVRRFRERLGDPAGNLGGLSQQARQHQVLAPATHPQPGGGLRHLPGPVNLTARPEQFGVQAVLIG